MERIVLFGQRWSGKTSIWEALRDKTWESFEDLDRYIVEKKLGWKSLSDFLKERWENGWFDFRKLESQTLQELLSINSKIISLWGGTLAFNQVTSSSWEIYNNVSNQQLVRRDNRVRVFLYAIPEVLAQRIEWDTTGNINRPPLPGEKETPLAESRRIYAERIATYHSQADETIGVWGKTIEQIVDEILLKVSN